MSKSTGTSSPHYINASPTRRWRSSTSGMSAIRLASSDSLRVRSVPFRSFSPRYSTSPSLPPVWAAGTDTRIDCFYNKGEKWYYAGTYVGLPLANITPREWDGLAKDVSSPFSLPFLLTTPQIGQIRPAQRNARRPTEPLPTSDLRGRPAPLRRCAEDRVRRVAVRRVRCGDLLPHTRTGEEGFRHRCVEGRVGTLVPLWNLLWMSPLSPEPRISHLGRHLFFSCS
jgi:hypothetical protein